MKTLLALALASLSTVAACGGDDGGKAHSDAPKSIDGKAIDAKPIDAHLADAHLVDAHLIDAPQATVVAVTCPTTPDATVTTSGFAYMAAQTTISVNQIIKFTMPPGTNHDVSPDATGSDPGLHVDFNAIACLQFTHTGTFGFHCSIHGFTGSITVN
jgi:plastocyanin